MTLEWKFENFRQNFLMKSDSSAFYFGSSEKFLSCCDFTIYNSRLWKQIQQRYKKQQKTTKYTAGLAFSVKFWLKKMPKYKFLFTEFLYFDLLKNCQSKKRKVFVFFYNSEKIPVKSTKLLNSHQNRLKSSWLLPPRPEEKKSKKTLLKLLSI